MKNVNNNGKFHLFIERNEERDDGCFLMNRYKVSMFFFCFFICYALLVLGINCTLSSMYFINVKCLLSKCTKNVKISKAGENVCGRKLNPLPYVSSGGFLEQQANKLKHCGNFGKLILGGREKSHTRPRT